MGMGDGGWGTGHGEAPRVNAIPILSGAWLERPLVWLHHRSEGRLRISAPGVELQPVRDVLAGLPGVSRCELSPTTGTLLIEHDGDEDRLLIALYASLPRRAPEPRLAEALKGYLRTADRQVLALTGGWLDLKTAVPLSLGLLGAAQLLSKGLKLPGNVTLLYWAFGALK